MMLTIASEQIAGASSDIANSMTAVLARRRARAGRNVLLVYQTPPSSQAAEIDTALSWMATEIKTGADIRVIAANDIGTELASAKARYHDILVNLPQRDDAGLRSVLAIADTALFALSVDEVPSETEMLASMHAASSRNPALQVLALVDDNAAGRSIMASLSGKIAHLRFIHLSARKRDDMTVGALYQAIYAHCTPACAS
jgi:hypothetical protein